MQPISFNIIREDILNQAEKITVFSMIAEEARTIAFQMLNKYSSTSQPIQSDWRVLVEFTTRTGAMFREANINSCDNNNSIFTVDLSTDDTVAIVPSRIIVWAINTSVATQTEIETLTVTGFADDIISLPNTVDLTDVEVGQFVEQIVSSVRKTFLILEVNDISGSKSIVIRPDADFDILGVHKIMKSSKIYKAVRNDVIRKEKARC